MKDPVERIGLEAAFAQNLGGTVRRGSTTASGKPNILVIMGDDIGIPNLSRYSHGMMGYRTPNIDRPAREGMMFTDYYAEQSCTAGRASFITGQTVLRTGLSRVGMPAAPVGLQDQDATLAELLKPHGYVTGQFGKNHLGDPRWKKRRWPERVLQENPNRPELPPRHAACRGSVSRQRSYNGSRRDEGGRIGRGAEPGQNTMTTGAKQRKRRDSPWKEPSR